jgi:hypothetical protein
VIEFWQSLGWTAQALIALLLATYVLLAIGAVAFSPGQVVQDQRARQGRHRRRGAALQDHPPVPPRGPVWLGGDESQGWWIWRDRD